MMDNKQSKLLTSRIDMKNYTISMFAREIGTTYKDTSDINNPHQIKPMFLTSFGMIQGELVENHNNSIQEDNRSIIDPMFVPLMKKRNETIAEWEQEIGENARLINDCQFMMLKNVVVTPYASPQDHIELDELILFSDQIVGISAGKLI